MKSRLFVTLSVVLFSALTWGACSVFSPRTGAGGGAVAAHFAKHPDCPGAARCPELRRVVKLKGLDGHLTPPPVPGGIEPPPEAPWRPVGRPVTLNPPDVP